MNKRKLLRRVLSGSKNIRFTDFVLLVEAFGFHHVRTTGSHRAYSHPGIPELINLQDERGQAKPYQVRQFIKLIERYNLLMDEEP